MTTTKRRSAAECIAFRYGWDYSDVTDMRYQARRGAVAVYTMFDGYVCCPPAGVKPPTGWDWKPDGEAYGRPIYAAE
jgi:hypothetical protein